MSTHDENGEAGEAPTNEPAAAPAPPEEKVLQFTERQLADFVNKAISARDRRFEKAWDRKLQEAVAAAKGQPSPPADPDQAAALAALQAIESERKAQLDEATQRERQLLERELRSEVEHQLQQLGSHQPRAARLVLLEDGRVRRNDAGDLVFVGDGDAETDLATGLKTWLSTDEGKHYMPPRGGGEGSGSAPRGRAPRTGGPPSRQEQRSEALGTLSNWMLGSGRR